MAAKHILVESNLGLHCLSLETGAKLWAFTSYLGDAIIGGLTPAVDQTNNLIYYQSYNRLWKLNALNGEVLDFVVVSNQTLVASGNTVLIDDLNGYFIACYYYASEAYGGAIKVYDVNLDLVWEAIGLNTTYKNSLCYHNGLLFTGLGDSFGGDSITYYTGEQEDCKVRAYDITNGSAGWTTVLSDPVDKAYQAMGYGVMQVVYTNGYLIVAQESGRSDCPTKIRVLDASDGSILKTYLAEDWSGACGQPSFSYGRLFKGDLRTNKVLTYQIGTGAKDDFTPFGTHKLNDDNVPDTALATLDANITALASVSGGTQGCIVYDGKCFCNNDYTGNGVVAFDVETLEVIRNYTSDTTWDSSPMVVKNLADEDVLLIKENTNKRVKAMRVSDGSLLWYSDTDMEGNLFFGFSYYDSSYVLLLGGFSSASMIKGINDNFTTLNALIASAATLIVITPAVPWTDINANIDSLNTNGVAVSVVPITEGMTGTQFNDIINNFVTDYNIANS